MDKIKSLNVVFYYFLSMLIIASYIIIVILHIENYQGWKLTALKVSMGISIVMFICGLFALPKALKNL